MYRKSLYRHGFAPVVLACSLLAGCGDDAAPGEVPQALAVTTRTLEAQPLPLVIETVGRTEGSREVQLRARVNGILEKQVYSEGVPVKAGAQLFRIDPVPYEIALAHARAALAQERAVQQQAQRNAERSKTLAAQNAVSRRQADDAISALEASEAAVLAAEAKVREAEVNLSYTRVTAPIAGIAGRAQHSEGSLVTAGTDSSLLTTVTQTDPIWIRFALSVAEYEALRGAGARDANALSVTLLGADGQAQPFEGRINFAGSTVDETLGTVQLRAEFANPRLAILPGEYQRVRVTGGQQSGITVPQAAVMQGSKGPYVWVVNEEGKAEQRDVRTGEWIGDAWRIRAGLTAGETVILDNLLKLHAGEVVRVQPLKAAADASQPAAPQEAQREQTATEDVRGGSAGTAL
jgi:membrane fusion protein, multidrug efflux system